ncbi:MAG: hypothetical protein WCP45_12465 [Verrucomicrobiota bacterium]
MKSVFAFLAFAAFGSSACADSLARQFAETIIRQNIQIPDDELDLSEWRLSISGGYVLNFSFDVDADGRDEQFFTSSFNADKLICYWTVYDGASGKELGIASSLRAYGFWWSASTSEMLDYARFGAEGGAAVFSRFDKNGLTTRTETALLDEVSLGLESGTPPRAGFQRFKPEVKICLLADIVSIENPSWRPLILDDVDSNYKLLNDRLLLKEDAARKIELSNFTPHDALRAIEKLREQKEPKPRNFQESDEPPSRGVLPMVKTDSKQTKPHESTPIALFWPWIAGTCLVMLAAWVMLKHRP